MHPPRRPGTLAEGEGRRSPVRDLKGRLRVPRSRSTQRGAEAKERREEGRLARELLTGLSHRLINTTAF